MTLEIIYNPTPDPDNWIIKKWLKLPPEEQKWIPLEYMQIGNYLCKARNFEVGYWNGREFEYSRQKFSFTFPDTEEYWDTGNPHGTVRPIRYLGERYEY